MFGLVVIVALVAAVVVGTVLGHRYRVGPPVLLILSGSLLGLIPRFGDVQIDGEVVLLLFLPAILYWESMNTSFREIRWNLRVIVMFSIGLVIATAVAVSWTARALGMESHAAAVLGAVLSPTDAAAVAGLAKRLPRRALTVLRGESLINDGTALVLFAVTVAVAEGAAGIGPAALVGRFVVSYLGGIMAGLLVGGLVTLLRRRIDAPLEEGALSLLTPFAAFLLAQSLKCSGVVAVLVSALVLTYVGPTVIRARSRLQAHAFWDIATFLINGSLWVFVGVQIPGAIDHIAGEDGGLPRATVLALAVTGVVIATRIAWVQATTVLGHTVDRVLKKPTRHVGFRQRCVTSWAGFRGAVSLAAALAVPMTTNSGAPFPDRNLIIFVSSRSSFWSPCWSKGLPCPPSFGGRGCPKTSRTPTNCSWPAPVAPKPPSTLCRRSPTNSGSPPISSNTWKRNTKNARCSSWPMAPTPRPAIWPSATIWSGACV